MPADPSHPRIFVGTYTEPVQSTSRGICVYRMDPSTGKLTFETLVKNILNPSYLAVHPLTGNVYTVNESGTFAGKPGGGVTALSTDLQSGNIHVRNTQSSGGEDPCYISIERTGRYALVANYSSGSVAMLPILPDGILASASDMVRHSGSSANLVRQNKPYTHCILPDPANTYAVACDLGIDQLLVYGMDLEAGKLIKHAEVRVAPGSGPRHLIFHPNGLLAYLVCELNSTVIAFSWDPEGGTLEELQTIRTTPPAYQGRNLPADIHITPDGQFLYASNRGHDSLASFAIDPQSGELTVLDHIPCGGNEPRGFEISPDGKFLLAANQNSNIIVTFLIDSVRGRLLRTGEGVEISMPVCIKFSWPGDPR